MHINKIDDMHRGWFIGNFEPSVLKTKDFEVCYGRHASGEYWAEHYHHSSNEYNYLIKGRIEFDQGVVEAGDIFIFSSGEWAKPRFLEDCELIVVRIPSEPNDKVYRE